MRFFQSLSVVGLALRNVIATAGRPGLWLPFLLVAAVQGAALLLISSFHRAMLLPAGQPLIKLLAGENATHYPLLYYALPTIFQRMNLAIGVLIAAITDGVATLLFARAFGFGGTDGVWSRALRRAPLLIIVSLLITGLWLGLGRLIALVPQEHMLMSFATRWGVRGGALVLSVLIQSLLIYTTAWIVLMGHKFWPAIRDSVRVTGRTFLPTVIVVGVSAVLLFPFSYLFGRVDILASKFKPEMVASLLGVQIVFQVLVAFMLAGAITRLFVWRVEAAR